MKLREDEPASGTLDVEGSDGDGRGPRRPVHTRPRPRRSSHAGDQVQGTAGSEHRAGARVRRADRPRSPRRRTVVELERTGDAHRDREVRGRPVDSLRQRQHPVRRRAQPRLQDERHGHPHLRQRGTARHPGSAARDTRPPSAEVTLEQAKASLQSAEANLAKLEETEGETTGSQGSSATGTAASTASTSSVSYATEAVRTPPRPRPGPTGEPPSRDRHRRRHHERRRRHHPVHDPTKAGETLLGRGPGLGVQPLDSGLAGDGSHDDLDSDGLGSRRPNRAPPPAKPTSRRRKRRSRATSSRCRAPNRPSATRSFTPRRAGRS